MLASLVPIVSLTLALGSPSGASEKDALFVLKADCLLAVEDGPVAVRVTLQYQGQKPIAIYGQWVEKRSKIQPPKGWKMNEFGRAGSFSGPTEGASSLWPREKITEIHYLHHDYAKIVGGKVQLRIEWPIHEPGNWVQNREHRYYRPGKLITRLSTTITVNVS